MSIVSVTYCMFVKQVRVAVPEENQGAWYIPRRILCSKIALEKFVGCFQKKMIKYYFSYTVPLLLVSNVKVNILGPMRITDIFKTLVLDFKMLM